MPPTRLSPNSVYSLNTYIHIHKSSQRSCCWRMPLGRIEKLRVCPSYGPHETHLWPAWLLLWGKEFSLFFVLFAAPWLVEIDIRSFLWVTHLYDPSGIMCSMYIHNSGDEYPSPYTSGPEIEFDQVWTLRAKTRERDAQKDGHLSNPWRSDSPRLLPPSLWSGRFLFIFQCEKCQPEPGLGARHNISPWLMMRIPVACHRLLFSWKTVTDADDFIWSFRLTLPYVLPTLAADVPWRFLPFIKPLFPLPGLWRDWKGEPGEEGKC